MEGILQSKIIDGIRGKISTKRDLKSARFRIFGLTISYLILFLFIFSAIRLFFYSAKLENLILVRAKAGENHLNLVQQSLLGKDPALAANELNQAKLNFNLALDILFHSGQKTFSLINLPRTGNKIIEGQKLLDSGFQISSSSQSLVSNLARITDSTKDSGLAIYQNINFISADLDDLAKVLQESKNKVADISTVDTNSLISQISQAQDSISFIKNIFSLLPEISGQNGIRHYLILFQNSAEVRATGGFCGNYGILTLDSGKITQIKVNDIYAIKWEYNQGKDLRFPSYTPLNFHSPGFTIPDSNWNSNFPTSAVRMENFYSRYSGQTPDGVIAADPKLIEDILSVIGPVNMPDYQVVLNDKNFRDQIQYKVEADNPFKKEGDRTANPKKILQDFTPLLVEKIKNTSSEQKSQILEKIFNNLSEKHILLYANNSRIQDLISGLNWSGEIKDTSKDYLHVSNTNISGTKSSLKVEENIKFSAKIMSDGTIIDEVKVVHNGKNLSGFMSSFDTSFIKILVPSGAELISAEYDNQEIPRAKVFQFKEESKTAFALANFSILSGQTKEIVFRYKLPFRLTSDSDFYSLLIQKQPGTISNPLSVDINLANNLSVTESIPTELGKDFDKINYHGDLANDRFFSLTLKYQD